MPRHSIVEDPGGLKVECSGSLGMVHTREEDDIVEEGLSRGVTWTAEES